MGRSPAHWLSPGSGSAGSLRGHPDLMPLRAVAQPAHSPQSELGAVFASLEYCSWIERAGCGQERVGQGWVQVPTHPSIPIVNMYPCQEAALGPKGGFAPLAQAGVRLHGDGPTPGIINSVTKICVAKFLARPWGRDEDLGE